MPAPPELELESRTIRVRQIMKGNPRAAKALEEFETRFGGLESALNKMDWVSADTAYMLQPQPDGGYLPVARNCAPGQLVTAFERGFLPLSRADYEKALETQESRKDPGEREAAGGAERPERKLALRDWKCLYVFASGRPCGKDFAGKGRAQKHVAKYHRDVDDKKTMVSRISPETPPVETPGQGLKQEGEGE